MKKSAGFTLIELLVTLGVFVILLTIVVGNVIHAPAQASLLSTTSLLVSDMKTEQLKSMLGDTSGTSAAQSYGIYFQNNQYTLFIAPYSATDPNNLVVTLSSDLQFSPITFPNGQLIFNRRSGEVQNFTNGSNSVALQNLTNGEQKTFTVNRYGTVTIQ